MGVIQPVITVKIAFVIRSHHFLHFALPRGDVFVIRFGRRCKIVRAVRPHFVKIAMYVGHPLVISGNQLTCNFLGLPSPIAVGVKQVMVITTTRPRLTMFPSRRIGIGRSAYFLIVPVYVAVMPIRIEARC